MFKVEQDRKKYSNIIEESNIPLCVESDSDPLSDSGNSTISCPDSYEPERRKRLQVRSRKANDRWQSDFFLSPQKLKFSKLFSGLRNRINSVPTRLNQDLKVNTYGTSEGSSSYLHTIGPSPVCVIVSSTGDEASSSSKFKHSRKFGSTGDLLDVDTAKQGSGFVKKDHRMSLEQVSSLLRESR